MKHIKFYIAPCHSKYKINLLFIFSKLRTPINKADRKEVVNRIPCRESIKIYIGLTQRRLKGHICYHKSYISRGVSSYVLAMQLPV